MEARGHEAPREVKQICRGPRGLDHWTVGGGGGGEGLVPVPPGAGLVVVDKPPVHAAVEEEAEAEDDPAARAAAAAVAVAVAVPPREKGHFVSVISRYMDNNQHTHLEYFLKSYANKKLQYEETVDLEHVALVLLPRMARVAYIAKVDGYDSAWVYFESMIRPLMVSKSPYANHGNKEMIIKKIESALSERVPVLIDIEKMKLSMCDYIRFNFPAQVSYPASEGLRSKYYEFVFPVAEKRFRCLLCQRVWSSKPSAFLEKHFKGKEGCANMTNFSRERYDVFTGVKAKRKTVDSDSDNPKRKEIKVESIENDEAMEKESENLDMHRLLSQGRACIHNLVGPFVNRDADAFEQVRKEMHGIFTSMEKVWASHMAGQYEDQQASDIQWSMNTTRERDMPESSSKGILISRDTPTYSGQSVPENDRFSHMPPSWTPAQQSLWDDLMKDDEDDQLLPLDPNDQLLPVDPNDQLLDVDTADENFWVGFFAEDEVNQNANTAATHADGVADMASEEVPARTMHGVTEIQLYAEEPQQQEAQTSLWGRDSAGPSSRGRGRGAAVVSSRGRAGGRA